MTLEEKIKEVFEKFWISIPGYARVGFGKNKAYQVFEMAYKMGMKDKTTKE
jgi:hypothetical protein